MTDDDQEVAIQLLTANLTARVRASREGITDAQAYETPEYRAFLDLSEELARDRRSATVLMEMTQFAATAIWRLAEVTGKDPLRLWQSIALGYARRDEEENDD